MQQRIEQAVAHVGPGCVGDLGRNPGFFDCLRHAADRKRRKIGSLPARDDGLVDGLEARVVRDAGVHQVDGDPFRRDGCPAARLPDAEHRVRPLRRQRVPQDRAAADKLGRHFKFT